MNESGEGCGVLEGEGVWRNLENFREASRADDDRFVVRSHIFIRIDGETPCRLEGRG